MNNYTIGFRITLKLFTISLAIGLWFTEYKFVAGIFAIFALIDLYGICTAYLDEVKIK